MAIGTSLLNFFKSIKKGDLGSIIYYAVEVIGVITLLLSLVNKCSVLFGGKKTDPKKDAKKDPKKDGK